MSTPTVTPTLPAPPTWSAYETLPDGREHLLAEHLRYTQMLGARFPEAVWAVVWRQDVATPSGPR
jgi:hypothetical protein